MTQLVLIMQLLCARHERCMDHSCIFWSLNCLWLGGWEVLFRTIEQLSQHSAFTGREGTVRWIFVVLSNTVDTQAREAGSSRFHCGHDFQMCSRFVATN